MPTDHHGFADGRREEFRDLHCGRRTLLFVDHHDELIATESSDERTERRNPPETVRDGDDELVASRVSKRVIHAFEVVDVGKDQRDASAGGPYPLDRCLQVIKDHDAVGKASQRVTHCLSGEFSPRVDEWGDVLEMAEDPKATIVERKADVRDKAPA